MIYPTDLLRAFAVVCSWRILGTKIYNSFVLLKICSYIIYFSRINITANMNIQQNIIHTTDKKTILFMR